MRRCAGCERRRQAVKAVFVAAVKKVKGGIPRPERKTTQKEVRK